MFKDFAIEGTVLIKYLGNDAEIIVPEGITKIKETAFSESKNPVNVILPSTIEHIEIGRCGRRGIYKTLPEWSFDKIGRLTGQTASLIAHNWLSQMTPAIWAMLYLTQDTKAFEELFKKHMTDNPNEYSAEMLKLLDGCKNPAAFSRASKYAEAYNKEIECGLKTKLDALVKCRKKGESSAEGVKTSANPEEAESAGPYARLYKKYDESELFKRYINHGGKLSALNGVLSADGSENVPQIVVLTAVVPYLDFFDKSSLFGRRNKKVKILPDSDKAASLTDRASLIDFINKAADIKTNTAWTYPYCRYASEKEIRELISARKRAKQNQNSNYSAGLPTNALLLSDCCSSMFELYKMPDKTKHSLNDLNWCIKDYANIRGKTPDVVLTDTGLDEHGRITYDLVTDKFTAFLTEGFKLKLSDEKTGSILKSFPALGGGSALYEEAKSDFSQKKGFVKQAVKIRKGRLFNDFLNGKAWNFDAWKHINFKTAINKMLAQQLVWEQDGKTFIIKDEKFINSGAEEYIPSDAPVKPAHPMEMNPEDTEAWKRHFKENRIQQPFLQLDEPVIDLKAVGKNRYKDIKVPLSRFANRESHGIECISLKGHNPIIKMRGCSIKYEIYMQSFNSSNDAEIEIYEFIKLKSSRTVNHIISLMDNWTLIERIKKDDMSAADFIYNASAADLEKYTSIAIESGAKNLTAKLLELKKERFPERGSLDDFTLGEW